MLIQSWLTYRITDTCALTTDFLIHTTLLAYNLYFLHFLFFSNSFHKTITQRFNLLRSYQSTNRLHCKNRCSKLFLLSVFWCPMNNHCDFIETSFRERALASVLTFVYSNHKTFGMSVVSRTSKYSDNFHDTITGKNDVKIL